MKKNTEPTKPALSSANANIAGPMNRGGNISNIAS